jgi:hypothetical protein
MQITKVEKVDHESYSTITTICGCNQLTLIPFKLNLTVNSFRPSNSKFYNEYFDYLLQHKPQHQWQIPSIKTVNALLPNPSNAHSSAR